MSIDLILEADRSLGREDVVLTFQRCGVAEFSEEDYGFSGNFPSSNMYFSVFERRKSFWTESGLQSKVLAEGCPAPTTWEVGTRIRFKYVMVKYDDCSAELHQFVEKLAQISKAYFLLSFQYENVYAIRGERGLELLGQF